MILPPPTSTLFPYTTLFRSMVDRGERLRVKPGIPVGDAVDEGPEPDALRVHGGRRGHEARPARDRKSTRLNSSHTVISYAVFCLKKKTKNQQQHHIHEPKHT